MNVTVTFDEINVKEVNDIGTVKILMLKGEKGDVSEPTDAQVQNAVNEWLDDHPEATTTVEDGSISIPKLANDVVSFINSKASAIEESASGNPATFNDGADGIPVKSLKVGLEPIQTGSGDPSPNNIRPIYPANNRNQFPNATDGTYTNSGVTVVANNGVYTVTGTGTATSYIEIPLVASVDLSPSKNQLAFMNTVNDGNIEFAVYRDSTRVHYWAMVPQNRVAANWTDTGNEVVNKIRFNFQSGKTYNITISPVLCLATYPTPTAFTPYQGIMVERCGRNLLNKNDVQNAYIDQIGVINNSSAWNTSQYVKINNNYKYTLSGLVDHPNTGTDNINQYDENYNLIGVKRVTGASGYPVQFDSGTEYVRFCWKKTDENTAMFAVGGDTTYEPYIGTSYPYTLGQNVYGGTVDLATGVLTVTHRIVDLGTLKWAIQQTSTSGKNRFRGYLSPNPIDSDTGKTPSWCTTYKLLAAGATFACVDGFTIASNNVYVYDSTKDTMTGAEFKTAVSGYELVYPLATPQTVQLTPTQVKTLLGYNNISSTGTVDVIYHADTKLYIDSLTEPDSDMVADMNIESGKYFIVNNHLYLSTTAIAQGETIVVGSNCQETNLADALNALI